jgi:uncharacterized protein (DUF3084 family)
VPKRLKYILSLFLTTLLYLPVSLHCAPVSWDDIMNEVKDDNSLDMIVPKDKEHYFKSKRSELQEIKEQIKKNDLEIKNEVASGLGANDITEQNGALLSQIKTIGKNLNQLDTKISSLRNQNKQLSDIVSKIIKDNDSNYRQSIEDIATLQNETNILKMQDKKITDEFTNLKVTEYTKRQEMEKVVTSFDSRLSKIEKYIDASQKSSDELEAQNSQINEVKKGVFFLADELKAMREQNSELKSTLIKLILEMKSNEKIQK